MSCLADAVVASWSLKQEVVGLSPFTVMTNIFVVQFNSVEHLEITPNGCLKFEQF